MHVQMHHPGADSRIAPLTIRLQALDPGATVGFDPDSGTLSISTRIDAAALAATLREAGLDAEPAAAMPGGSPCCGCSG